MMERPKTLPPTLRDKKRYIAFKVISETQFNKDEVKDVIWKACLRTLGELGTAKAKPWLIKFDETTQMGIVRCDRNHVYDVIFSLTLVSDINGNEAIIKVLGVSGTIKRLKRKFLSQFGWR
ncbi:MAG: ribonuclease protein subunit [Pyrococcus sp.]|uniref:ribonuclease P protein component 2 n=1 Tax=Pyrococcus sp. TaxID=33866 RepID=UPI00258EDE7F|nr:ribonuclease P protein component 2 [Pyrococcus sp.]MDK2868899.1 ribonuclease protein subunit [Pyrococcus sp.]